MAPYAAIILTKYLGQLIWQRTAAVRLRRENNRVCDKIGTFLTSYIITFQQICSQYHAAG